jgi:transposase
MSNTATDFLLFVADLLTDGVLAAGDVFVMDNCSIHYADNIASILDDLLAMKGVRLYFLPAYSPELNPCELVFAQVKYYLRRHRGPLPFVFEIALAFSQVSKENVRNYYQECLGLQSV